MPKSIVHILIDLHFIRCRKFQENSSASDACELASYRIRTKRPIKISMAARYFGMAVQVDGEIGSNAPDT
jgi:hypothetical protein